MTTPLRLALALALVVIALGCRVGPNPARSPAATSPHGIVVMISGMGSTGRVEASGELLAVRADGLLLEHPDNIVLYQFGSFQRARRGRGQFGPDRGYIDSMDSEGFAAWRPYARHPDGLSDEHLALLIRAKGQDSLVVRRP